MIVYDNVLASAYKFYGQYKNENPYISSIGFVFLCQLLFLFMLVLIVKSVGGFDLLKIIPNKYYMGAFALLVGLLDFKYYSKERVKLIIEKFDAKSARERFFWDALSLVCLIGPIIYIFCDK